MKDSNVDIDLEVEKIVDMREENGTKQFLLKWKGFGDLHNTWEPETNLNCPELVKAFIENHAMILGEKKQISQEVKKEKFDQLISIVVDEDDTSPKGFSRGLQPKKILGVTKINGELYFLIKWSSGKDNMDLVRAREANAKCPQMVINFYEQRLDWSHDQENVQEK